MFVTAPIFVTNVVIRAGSFGGECGYFSWYLILVALIVTLAFVLWYFLTRLLTQEVHPSTRGETFYFSLCGNMSGQKKISPEEIHFTTVEKQLS